MARPKHALQPARGVIDLLGGCRPMARALDISPSTITRWASPAGCKGRIPQRYWNELLALARSRGLALSLHDLHGVVETATS